MIIQALIKICQLYPINIEWTCLHHFFINIQTSEATSTLIHTETFQGGIYISPNFHRSEKKNKTTTLEIRKNMIAFCPGLHLLYNQHNLQTAKKKKKRGYQNLPSLTAVRGQHSLVTLQSQEAQSTVQDLARCFRYRLPPKSLLSSSVAILLEECHLRQQLAGLPYTGRIKYCSLP